MIREEKAGVWSGTLYELWEIFVHCFWVMILATVAVAGGVYLVSQLNFVPVYSSTATLYILWQNSDTDTEAFEEDFSLAMKVVNDCDYFLKSQSVLDEVIRELDLDISCEDLRKNIDISNPENTRILEVTVMADSPETAKEIADVVCKVGQEKITDVMGFQQVNLYEYGTLNMEPCNTMSKVHCLFIGIIVALFVHTMFLVSFLLDDRIRTNEDVERYLGLSILGDIPNANNKKY